MVISIIIPARNEADNIGSTLEALEQNLARLDHETIVVNDHSTDRTVEKVIEVSRRHPAVKLVANTGNPGFASTLWAGFKAAKGDAVVPVMADACDDPATILEMAAKFSEGYDLVCGSRYLKGGGKDGGPKMQGLFSFLINKILRIFFRMPTTDASNAFKLYRREALLKMETKEKGFALSMELAINFWKKGYNITDVPTCWKGRGAGRSKFKFGRAFLSYGRQILHAQYGKLPKT